MMRPLTLLENLAETAFLDCEVDSALKGSELGLNLFLGEVALSDESKVYKSFILSALGQKPSWGLVLSVFWSCLFWGDRGVVRTSGRNLTPQISRTGMTKRMPNGILHDLLPLRVLHDLQMTFWISCPTFKGISRGASIKSTERESYQ